MTQTENYQLSQWDARDAVRREDFNSDNAKIDAALAESRAAAEQADAALSLRVDAAQAAADAAQSTADTARTEAAALPHVISYYIGNGTDLKVTLGFAPFAVYITGETLNAVPGSYSAMACGAMRSGKFDVNNTGFRVMSPGTPGPILNENGRRYNYVAFR